MIRLLHWNILHGGGARRLPEITLAILAHQPDVVLLSEFRTTTGGQIAGMLADRGLIHQHHTKPVPGSNGLLLASRFEWSIGDGPTPPGRLASRWLDVALGPPADFWLTGVHVPDGHAPDPRAHFWQSMVELSRARHEQPHLFLGDLNTGRHRLDEAGATFTCTSALGKVATLGYSDAFRHFQPDGREATWSPPARRAFAGTTSANTSPPTLSNGFRLDSALVSRPLLPRLRRAWYSHAERQSRISDHSVMLLEIDKSPA